MVEGRRTHEKDPKCENEGGIWNLGARRSDFFSSLGEERKKCEWQIYATTRREGHKEGGWKKREIPKVFFFSSASIEKLEMGQR